jgi:hypothetical protein
MAKLKLSPPWSIFYDKIRAMFIKDPEVKVVMEEESYTIYVFVNNADKSSAIAQILEQEKKFGRITLKVQVPPPDGCEAVTFRDGVELYKAAFENNPRLSFIQPKTSIFDTSFYVVFKNEVVQYFNDDISDIYGNCSTLAEDIARDIFVGDLPNFCTDVPEPTPNK